MSRPRASPARPYQGRPDKRRAIVDAARVVFGRDGFARASMDAIAAEAGVSKRTIYNHFPDKEQLFLTVAMEGTVEVTATIAAIADRHLRKIVDLEQDLVDFGLDRAITLLGAADHFALVRTINAEADRIPRNVLDALREAGPRASQRDIARYLRQIADRGLLAIADADEAANHFTLLTFTDVAIRSYFGAIPIAEAAVAGIVAGGVRAFLRLYRPGDIP